MRTIKPTTQFKRDYKRESRTYNQEKLDTWLTPILTNLANDLPLEPRFLDHPLTGEWKGFRDCHVRPDLVLIYQKSNKDTLCLVRLGSHSELEL